MKEIANTCDFEEGVVADGEFFVSGGHATAFLQVTDQTFDGVAFFICLTIKRS